MLVTFGPLRVKTSRVLGPKCARSCFWDGYWGRAGQLLVNFSPSQKPLGKLTRPCLLIFKVANSDSQRCCGLLQ